MNSKLQLSRWASLSTWRLAVRGAAVTLLALGCREPAAPVGLQGRYELETVDGHPVPAYLFARFGVTDSHEILGGSIEITGDRAELRELWGSGVPGDPDETQMTYTVEVRGDTVNLLADQIPGAYPRLEDVRLIASRGVLTRSAVVRYNAYTYTIAFVYRRQ